MQVSLLYQGLSTCKESVGSILLESFQDTAFNSFNCLSAFASVKGLSGIKEAINNSKGHIENFHVAVGIDQNGTSKEALETLLSLDIGASIYYTASPIIFHPKVYLFDGKEKSRIIIGSSNLTQRGLFQNFEASFRVDFSKPDEHGDKLLKEVQEYLNYFFNGQTVNSQKITPELIQRLSEKHIIPTEAEKKKLREQKKAIQKTKKEATEIDEINKLFPSIGLQSLPEGLKFDKPKLAQEPFVLTTAPEEPIILTNANPPPLAPVQIPSPQNPWSIKGELLWQKKLTPRDLQIVSPRSAPTGVLSLTRGFEINGNYVDWRTYFKEKVFSNFIWVPDRESSEAVTTRVKFNVKIAGVDLGQYELKLRHNPKWESKENNYTTGLSWGALTISVRNPELIGKMLSLYAPLKGEKEPFFIEIEGQLSKKRNHLEEWFG